MKFNDPNKMDDEDSSNEDHLSANNILPLDEQESPMDNEDDNLEEVDDQEYSLLDKQLDDLNTVLDVLEQKNDSIQSQLRVLLENSREIRKSMATDMQSSDAPN